MHAECVVDGEDILAYFVAAGLTQPLGRREYHDNCEVCEGFPEVSAASIHLFGCLGSKA